MEGAVLAGERLPQAPRAVLHLCLKWLQAPAMLTALLFCLWGRGKAIGWLALFVSVPALRLALDGCYRARSFAALAGLWAAARDYAAARGPLPWRSALALVVVPASFLYLSSNRTAASGDSWPVLPTACSLVLEGNWELSEFVRDSPHQYVQPNWDGCPYCTVRTPSGLYSSYPAGMVQFALPVAGLARLTGADLASTRVQSRLEKWTATWVAALCLGLFFLIALRLAEPLPALLTTLLLAGGSVMFSTVSHALWQHGGVIFWSLTALLVEFHTRGRPGWRGAALQGLACGMMLPCRLSAALFVLPFGAWVLVRQPRRAFLIAACAALAYLPWALIYLSIYGNPVGPSTGQMAGWNWAWPADSLLGLFFSPARGLLIYQPWLVLVVLAVLPPRARGGDESAGRGLPAGWQAFCLAAAVLQVALVGCWWCWWGGHCWGSRLLSEAVPLLGLLCVRPVALLCAHKAGKAVLVGLAAVAFFLHAAGTYWEPCWESRVALESHLDMLWSWSRPPFLIRWQGRP